MKPYTLIGAASGWGGNNPGTHYGPYVFRSTELQQSWAGMVDVGPATADCQDPLPHIIEHSRKLADIVCNVVQQQIVPVVIGGDHSIAMGTWSGVTCGLQQEGNFGLLWIDAHMDAHTPETSHQGKWGGHYHGMPVAHLMGYGRSELSTILSNRSKINPQHLVLLGIRSFEEGERALLQQQNVTVIYMDEILCNGLNWAVAKALSIVAAAPGGFGISLDLDGLDPQDAPAVASPENKGLRLQELLILLKSVGGWPSFKALEITEFQPQLDVNGQTGRAIGQIIASIFAD